MPAVLDPRDLVIRHAPPEWPNVPEELIARLTAGPPDPVWNPVLKKWHFFPAIPILTAEQKAMIDRIAASRWFLVRIPNLDSVSRCNTCGGQHRYFTVACVELPFNGISDLSQALLKDVRDIGKFRETTYDAVALGDIEPITETRAQVFRERIIMKGRIPAPRV